MSDKFRELGDTQISFEDEAGEELKVGDKVYVTSDHGMTGHIGKIYEIGETIVCVEIDEDDGIAIVPKEHVFGMWMLEDW